MLSLESFLASNQLSFERHEHPAAMTVADSDQLIPNMAGSKTKNLFLRDKKGNRHFLVTVDSQKRVDLAELSVSLDCTGLSFGSHDRLMTRLGVMPGSVSLLALYRDVDHFVEFVIDQCLWDADAVQAHPMVNTATMIVPHSALEKFLAITGHRALILDIPSNQL